MKTKQDFEYSLKELGERIDAYFDLCDEKGQKYSDAGLCLALDIPHIRMKILSRLGDEYLSLNPAVRGEFEQEHGAEFAQWRHLVLLKRALLRVQGQLAVRTDSCAIFQMKQPWLGEYSDKQTGGSAAVNVSIRLVGMGREDAFG